MTRRTAARVLSAVPFMAYANAFQQNRMSPHDTVSTDLNDKKLSITYGRPYLKGRGFGSEVAPYGQVWRLGADEATKLTISSSAKVQGGPELAAGSYSLWTIPAKDKWTFIVNKQADVWGTNYDQSSDLARFDVPVRKTTPTEEFTIAVTKKSEKSVEISFAWGTQMASFVLTFS